MTPSPRSVANESFARHASWVRRLAIRLTNDEADADDVAQDVWLRTAQQPPRATSRAWLEKVVRTKARVHRLSESRRKDREQRVARHERLDAEPTTVAEQRDVHQHVFEAVVHLKEPYRSTLLARYVDEQTVAEIAQRDNVPEATVRTRLRRGTNHVRAQLDRRWRGRRPWIAAVAAAPWTEPSGWAAVGVSRAAVAVIGVVLATLAGGLWLASRDDRPSLTEPPITASPDDEQRSVVPIPAVRQLQDQASKPPSSDSDEASNDDSTRTPRTVVYPKNRKELVSLLEDVEGGVVETQYASVPPFGSIHLAQHPSIPLSVEEALALSEAAVASYRPRDASMGLAWPHEVRLHLKGQRSVTLCVAESTLFIRGLGDSDASRVLTAQVDALVRRATDAAIAASGVALGAEGLRHLPKEAPHILGYALRDADLAGLSRFVALTSLDLSPSAETITDAGLRHLEATPSLRTVTMRNTRIRGDGLLSLTSVEELRLEDATALTPAAFTALGALPRLSTLSLSGSHGMNPETLMALAASTSLTTLDVGQSRLTIPDVTALGHVVSLESLNLERNHALGASALGALATLPRLKELDLKFTDVDEAGLVALASSPSLVSLDLMGQRDLAPNALAGLARLETLRTLNLASFAQMTDAQAAAVGRLTQVESLNLHWCHLSDRGVRSLAPLTNLRALDLGFSRMGDTSLQAVLESAVDMQSLRLTGCKQLTDAILPALRRHPALTALDLSLCEGLSDKGVATLVAARPECLIELPRD